MHAKQEKNDMKLAARKRTSPSARPLRPALALLYLLATGAWPVLSAAADAQAAASRPPVSLRVDAGTQKELLIPKGIERMAIADETVAGVALTRQSPNSPAARLIVTGNAAGRTTLMVWEKGQLNATVYALEVRGRAAPHTPKNKTQKKNPKTT